MESTFVIQENISDYELKVLFAKIRNMQEEIQYKDKYYNNIRNEYEIRQFITSKGEMFTSEVLRKRHPNQDEIDGAYFFCSKGYSVIFLSEAGAGQHPDMLIDGVLVEFKTVRSDIANSISNRVKQAINKEHTEIPVIFLIEKSCYVNNLELLRAIEKKQNLGDFRRNFKIAILIKNGQLPMVIKNMPGGSSEPA